MRPPSGRSEWGAAGEHPAHSAAYPSTSPCCLMIRCDSSREILPWNQCWVRWITAGGGQEGGGSQPLAGATSQQADPFPCHTSRHPPLGGGGLFCFP